MKTKSLIFAIFLMLFILSLRFYFYFNKEKEFRDGDRVRITTRVVSEPIRYETAQYLRLEGLKTYLPLYPAINYGDKIAVEGTVKKDKLISPKLVFAEESKGYLYSLRRQLITFYKSTLPEPHSSLVAGMTIGSKSEISKSLWDKLKKSGTAHVVVASGMNVSLVAGYFTGIFSLFLKRSKAIPVVIAGIWSYALLCGFDAPVIRAATMGTVAFVAQFLGKQNLAMRALVLSAVLMLLFNPIFITDIGFYLSFLATLGIVLLNTKLKKLIRFLPKYIGQDLSTSLAAQLFVAPVLFLSFGQFNILSPIANVLISFVIVPITVIGMIGGLVGLAVPALGRGILLLSYPLTVWFMTVVSIFG